MHLLGLITWLVFIGVSVVSAIALWVTEHPYRVYGFGVLLLLTPTFLGIYLYKHNLFTWLFTTSLAGIFLQLLVVRKLAESDS